MTGREQGAPMPIRHPLGTVTSAEGTRLSSSNRPDQATKYGPGGGEGVQVEARTPVLVEVTVEEITRRWRPGSHDTADTPNGANLAWTWADEAHYLLTEQRDYQLGVIERAHQEGNVAWVDHAGPILLGSDGRVWDGHHRICAAMTLGFRTVMVEAVAPTDLVTLTGGGAG